MKFPSNIDTVLKSEDNLIMLTYLTMMNFLVKSSKAKMMCETRTPRTIRARADLTITSRIMTWL